MDLILKRAKACGFHRIAFCEQGPLIFHCVPGAGKSTLIRSLLSEHSKFRAYTFGVPDNPNLSGRYIKSVSNYSYTEGEINLLDEYCEGALPAFQVAACFGDPLQSAASTFLREANFICTETLRFGRQTCLLLNNLGYCIKSNVEDELIHGDLFSVEPSGVVVAYEDDVYSLLESNSCEYKKVCEIRGKTFESVTLVTSGEFGALSRRSDLFQCLTRHRAKLTILSPDASYSTD